MCEDLRLLLAGSSPSYDDSQASAIPDHNVNKIQTDDVNREFTPVTKASMCYIVCGLAFDDDDKVLMMQEAKVSCKGMWYLPAGRLEPNETLVQGVKREVLEETGLHYEPDTMLCIEFQGANWQRVTFYGHVTSGRLKPKPDEDSLDAKWMKWPDLKDMPIRSADIFDLISLGLEYHKRDPSLRFSPSLPILNKVRKLLLRLAIVREEAQGEDSPSHFVLSSSSGRLPVVVVDFYKGRFQPFVTAAVKHITNSGIRELTCHGVLATEHDGRPQAQNDGSCHTLLFHVNVKDAQAAAEGFRWERLGSDFSEKMKKKLKSCPPAIFL